MTEQKALQIVLAARPQGAVRLSDFAIKDIPLPTVSVGKLLLEVNYLSLDPYMRGRMDDRKSYAEPVQIGAVMPGESISTVVTSQAPGFAPGDLVLGYTGWCTHAAMLPAGVQKITRGSLPVSTQLGVLGMPGFTAYGGLKEIGRPKKGETVVVAAAGGPVGSLVGPEAHCKMHWLSYSSRRARLDYYSRRYLLPLDRPKRKAPAASFASLRSARSPC